MLTRRLPNQSILAALLTLTGLPALVGYHWWQWQRDSAMLAAKWPPPPAPPLDTWERLPHVNVLVAAWNEAAHITALIKSVLHLRYPHVHLVLCAGGVDGTYQRALAYTSERVTVVEQPAGAGKQHALHLALLRANGEIIFLTDADCVLNDATFEAVLYPVATGQEAVCSGQTRPLPAQMRRPFVVAQAAPQLYSFLAMPDYASGLKGANTALLRTTLATVGGFSHPAPSGTDYVLAKLLTRHGVRIRQAALQLLATDFPETVPTYLRQQRRWLRNVRCLDRAWAHPTRPAPRCVRRLVGAGMLLLPGVAVVGGEVWLAVWGLLIGHAWLSRWRYLRCAAHILGTPCDARHVAYQLPMLLLDCVAWSQPLLDYLPHRKRWRW
ncbi:MAG: glycosyltransferase [Chloroflexaceae bacterium]|nr:glycosyltransferase [Chloroflexaceae bacterium]